jgi:N-methylhydantoinase B/oxoprolinase/acetone carboxylase alpha subunit
VGVVVEDYGLVTVQEYMIHIRRNAEKSVRNLLRDVAKRAGTNVLTAVDYLDDGSPVRTPSILFILLFFGFFFVSFPFLRFFSLDSTPG